jgi:prepilin-type N-terminal cleavage/methylation domain-containing protein
MRPRQPQRGGFTLIEILFTLVLLGVLISLATPAMGAWIARTRLDRVTNQLAVDLFYAKMLAVRAGQRVEIRFATPISGCVPEYRIVVTGPNERQAKMVDLRTDARGLCLTHSTGAAKTTFTSRGLPLALAYSYTITGRGMSTKITVSAAGRVYRIE